MKRLKWAGIASLAVVLSGLGWFGIAQAQSITATVPKGQTIDGSVYSAGQTVRISGTVNGDVHCAGQDVLIDGTVKGDVLCVGQNVKISGPVEGSIRVAAQDILIDDHVGRSVSVAGDRVLLSKDAHIMWDATIAGNAVDVIGEIERDATIASSRSVISGTIGRHLTYNGSQLALENGAKVLGGITYKSERSITINDNAEVKGEVERKKSEEKKQGTNWAMAIGYFLAMLMFAVVLVLIWPQAVNATSNIAAKNLGKTMLTGIVALFAVPVVLVLMAFTLVGIPAAVFGLLAWLLVLMLSGPIAAYYLGRMILSKAKNPVLIMLFGASLLLVLNSVPVISFFVMLLAYIIGSGAILLKIKSHMPKPKYSVK